jgi:acetyl esterase/lipase
MLTRLRFAQISFAAIFFVFATATTQLMATDRADIPVWPNRPPGLPEDQPLKNIVEINERIGRKVTRVNRPVVTIYKPAKAADTGASVVICPGGGYHILALDLEGSEIAEWLNEFGVTGIVLQYRVPRAKDQPFHVPPLQDVQRAISLARHNAKEWKIDPERVGVLGFSAGGHLGAAAVTNHAKRAYEPIDDVDKHSCRPDFGVLVYPAYLTEKETPLKLTPELPVNATTPPTILIHTDDDGVPATNSVAFYLALRKAAVATELHIYPDGGHGYGLRPSKFAVTTWPGRVEAFMRSIEMIPALPEKK